jgi:hypothetical protein
MCVEDEELEEEYVFGQVSTCATRFAAKGAMWLTTHFYLMNVIYLSQTKKARGLFDIRGVCRYGP